MTRRTIGFSFILIFLSNSNVVGAPRSIDTSRIGFVPSATVVDSPAICRGTHNVGNMVLPVGNDGTFGARYGGRYGYQDCFTGETRYTGCEFPKGSGTDYLYRGAFWIGALVYRDTLVSVGAEGWDPGGELFPDVSPQGKIIYRSITDPTSPRYLGAVSEQDYIAKYFDTCLSCPGMLPDRIDFRSHRPLHIEVTQRSYAWSYSYAQNFVLFDYTIRNIGLRKLSKVYMGIHVDSDVNSPPDDIVGFRRALPASYSPGAKCTYEDSLTMAWVADNDGDSDIVSSVTATRIVRTPTDDAEISFNWWAGGWGLKNDFGPQRKDKYRSFGTEGDGFPSSDRNKYWVLRNKEIDYD